MNLVVAAFFSATNAPADHGDCGQPLSKGHRPATVDALVALKTSIHLQHCGDDEDDCECDVDDSGSVTTRDTLTILRAAVGFPASLDCDCGTPGTTVPGSTSTTLDDDDEDGDDDDGDDDDGDDNGDNDDDDGGDDDDGDTTTTTNPI
jgi:hypothetical protein